MNENYKLPITTQQSGSNWQFDLIRPREIHFAPGSSPAYNTRAVLFRLIQWNVACGGFGVFLDLRFTCRGFAPIGKGPAIRDDALEVLIVFGFVDFGIAVFCGALEECILYFDE